MQSKAATVEQYLASLPDDRREALAAIRKVILKNLDKGYEEGMQYGMIGYYVPHSVYPAGYHCDPRQPLPFAGLASQKNSISLYLGGVYCGCVDGEPESKHAQWFKAAWAKTGKKLDMGKACIRFKKLEDVALDVVGEAIRRVPAKDYIAFYESSLAAAAAAKGTRKPAAKKAAKTAGKKAAKKAGKPAAKATRKSAAK